MRSRATCAVTPGGTWRTISSSTMRFEDGMINPIRAVMPQNLSVGVPTSNSSLAWRHARREHAMTHRSCHLLALAIRSDIQNRAGIADFGAAFACALGTADLNRSHNRFRKMA